jgi:hypothetical protein
MRTGFLFAAAWVLPLGASTADDIADLIKNSPFGNSAADKIATPVQPQLELRGVVVEGNVTWFTFFDGATKKWLTLRKGEEADSLVVKRYDRERDLVVLDYNGKTLSLALKPAGNQSYAETSTAYAAAAAPAKAPLPQPILMPALSEAEAHRIALVAATLKQRDEQSKHMAFSSAPKG